MSRPKPPQSRAALADTEASPAPRSGPRHGLLLVTAGGPVGRAIPLTRAVSFGRAERCTVCLEDRSLSRTHAEVVPNGDAYLLRDCGSTNGTFVNDERVDFGTTLCEGDRIRIGHALTLRFALVDAAEETALVQTYEAAKHQRELVAGAPATFDPGAPAAEPVVADARMQGVYADARRAAQGLISVLILGETGVGKEVLARAIHMASPRALGPFVAVDCAALPEALIEAELFGHERGAFTGAVQAQAGLFETANGGTVFLDEIGELQGAIQPKLLRVLETRAVLRVGGRSPRSIDVRFVSATNRDLEAEVARGAFRRDLFFRLNGIALTIPPLRERPSELAALARGFARAASQQLGRADAPAFSEEVLQRLLEHPWPGNVRELRNVIERAVVLCDGPEILPAHLPPALRDAMLEVKAPEPREPAGDHSLRDALGAVEKARILEVLGRFGGNQSRAAEALGMSRRALVSRLSAWGLTRSRSRA